MISSGTITAVEPAWSAQRCRRSLALHGPMPPKQSRIRSYNRQTASVRKMIRPVTSNRSHLAVQKFLPL